MTNIKKKCMNETEQLNKQDETDAFDIQISIRITWNYLESMKI